MDDDERSRLHRALTEQQLRLHPTVEKVGDYLEQYAHAAELVHAVGIDREAMSVVVYWHGQHLDPLTATTFMAITQQTGIPITIIAMTHSPTDIRLATDRIWAQQTGVRRVGYDVEAETLEVGVDESPHRRPDSVVVNGATVPVRYRLSDVQPLDCLREVE